MKKRVVIILSVFFLISCNNTKDKIVEKKNITDSLKLVLDEYISNNPLTFSRLEGKSVFESGNSYPSYHLYFDIKKKDTILSLVLSPHLNTFELEGQKGEEGETIYKTLLPKGVIYYNKTNPLIIFDNKKYSNPFIEEDNLIKNIPDSLKVNENNRHIKFVKWDFKIKNGEFNRLTPAGL